MHKNQIKNKSTNSIKPIAVNERDKSLLSAIGDYRILNTEQVFRLFFPSIGRARKRLRQPWQHGYLKRIVMPTRMGEGSSMFLYLPAGRSLRIISDDIVSGKMGTRLSLFHIDRTLAVNTFRICLQLATRRSKHINLDSWKEGRGIGTKATVKDKTGIRQIPIIPDAYFSLKHDNRPFHYYLEIDCGTTDLKRISLKCRGYLSMWQEKIAHAKFGIRSFRVLYVTTTEKRLSNIIERLSNLQSHHDRIDLILISNRDSFSLNQSKRLFDPVWKILDNAGNIREIGLLPITPFQSSRRREENHHFAVQNLY
jgi:hypothetical protein